MWTFLADIDRRWIFLVMLIVVSVPILQQAAFPTVPTPMVLNVRDAIEDLPPGSLLLMAYDYDPASKGELEPMAEAFTRHAALKGHKMIFLSLWPQGPPMIQNQINTLNKEFPDYEYGVDYVNLGFAPGNEGVIPVLTNNIRALLTSDSTGAPLDSFPITRDLHSIQEVDMIVNVSSGQPGTREWVRFASSPYHIPTVAGTTGVQVSVLYPYIPGQMIGVLPAIKGAAEYEQSLLDLYPDQLEGNPNAVVAKRRMAPQEAGHLAILTFIVIGNVVMLMQRRRRPI